MEGMESCDLPEYKAIRDSDFFKPFFTALPHILDKAVTKIGKYLEMSNRKVIVIRKSFFEGDSETGAEENHVTVQEKLYNGANMTV